MIRIASRFALVVLSGCAAIASYPSAVPEETYAQCHDGRDSDFDDAIDCRDDSCASVCVERCDVRAPPTGRVDEDQDGWFDCDDEDCDGSCPEDTVEACSDGRDQDGDGLVDFDDPACWHLAEVTVESCTSVAAVDRTMDFDGSDETWAHRGEVMRPDPTGRFSGDSLVVTSFDESSTVTLRGEIASAVVGLRITASMYFDAAFSTPTFGVNIADVGEATDGYLRLAAGIVRNGAVQQVGLIAEAIDGSGEVSPTRWDAPAGWYDFELSISDAEQVVLRVTDSAGELVATRSAALTHHLETSHRFELFITPAIGAGDLVVIGELRWHGEPFWPCGVETPSPTDAFASLVIDGVVLPDEMCLLTSADGVSLSLAQSMDRALTLTRAPSAEVVGMRIPRAAARERDGSVATLSQEVRGLFPSSRHFVSRSEDCTHLSDVASFDLPGPTIIGMRAIGDGYQLVRTSATRMRSGPVVLDEITGEGFVRASTPLGDLPAGDVRAILVGNDVLFTNLGAPGRIVVRSTGPQGSSLETTVVEVAPSRRAGACDEERVLSAILTLDPSPIVEGANATGLVLVPRCNAENAGLVAHRFTVRRPADL